jgi:hypothetical protein
MTDQVRQCPKCNSAMEDGFLLDNARGSHLQTLWIEGEPESSIWTGGLKTKGRTTYPITTYRCTGCGYLESYTMGASETLLRAADTAASGDSRELLRAAEETAEDAATNAASGGEQKYE